MSDALGIVVNTTSGSNSGAITIVDYGTFDAQANSSSNRYGAASITSAVSGAAPGWGSGASSYPGDVVLTLAGPYIFAFVNLTSGSAYSSKLSGYTFTGCGSIGLPNTGYVTCTALATSGTSFYAMSVETVAFTETTVALQPRYGNTQWANGNWYVFG